MPENFTALEIFTGAGGLAIGLHQAGFQHTCLIELNKASCNTLTTNQHRGFDAYTNAEIINADVKLINFKKYQGQIDLVAGGPPCQPFSRGGKGLGMNDARDLFPEAIRAVAEIEPRAFLFENVTGLSRSSLTHYINYLKLRFEFPHFPKESKKTWETHYKQLQAHKKTGKHTNSISYDVSIFTANAADYGIPQKRHRLFIVGLRKDLQVLWRPPAPTHSENSLYYEQHVSKAYWAKTSSKRIGQSSGLKIRPHFQPELDMHFLPWKTVRQALLGLPAPIKGKSLKVPNHEYLAGAKQYPGHTGSRLDEPSKTLKAGSHGVPGGENMILFANGKVRYFTMRECARLQTFPDDYIFSGSWAEIVKQLGNAVPVMLAEAMARSLKSALINRKKILQSA